MRGFCGKFFYPLEYYSASDEKYKYVLGPAGNYLDFTVAVLVVLIRGLKGIFYPDIGDKRCHQVVGGMKSLRHDAD